MGSRPNSSGYYGAPRNIIYLVFGHDPGNVVVGPRAEGIGSSPLIVVDERRPTGSPESRR